MHLGQYLSGESVIHRLDPRIKIGFVVLLSLLILRGDLYTEAVLSIFLAAVFLASRLAPYHMANALKPTLVFFVLLFLLHLFFTDGTPIPPFPHWRVTPTYQGFFRGVMTTWQFILLILSASILTMTTSPTELVNGIERLLRPLKIFGIPSHDVAIMVSVALRFVPTFLEEIDKIKDAQLARGARLKTGPFVGRIRAAISLLLPLVMGALRRADELATAMEARGYRRGPRTYIKELHMTRGDYVAIVVMVCITGFSFLQKPV